MWSLLFALPLLAVAPLAQAQSGIVDYGKLPACAKQCAQLTNADAACTSTPSTEKTCFCQSAYLTVQTDLFTTPDGTCVSECPSASDRTQIQNWFIGVCKGDTTASTATTSSASSASGTATAKSGQKTPSNTSSGLDNANQSWWDGHAKWVAMVIVLIVAFVLIIFLGLCLKKRHDRKVNQASTVPLPSGWGPNSDPHAYPGPNAEKSAAVSRSRRNPNKESLAEQGKNRKLQKILGR